MGLDLVTRAEYKSYAGLTSPNQDAVIDAIIPKVSQLVKTLCRRTFVDHVDETKIEYFDGNQYFFPLAEYPVLSISSVETSSDYGNNYSELTEYTDYYLNKQMEAVSPIGSDMFELKPNGYKVTYTAGYEALPQDLKLAVLDLITYYIKNDQAVHSNKAPGTNAVQIEYITTTSLPAHIKRVLDLYVANYL